MPARPLQRRQGSRRIVETTARGFQNRAADASASRSNRREYPNRGVETASAASSSISEASPTATIETARTRPPTRQGQPVAFVDMGGLVRDHGQRFVVAGKIGRIVANHRRPARKRERVGAERRRAAKTDRRNRIDAVAPGENARGGGDAPPPDRRNAARTKQRSVHSVERSPSHLRFQAFGNQDDGEIGRERNRGAQSENARDRQEGDRL